MRVNFLFLLIALTKILSSSATIPAASSFNYLFDRFICNKLPPPNNPLNGCYKYFTLADLAGYESASESTIATWIKGDMGGPKEMNEFSLMSLGRQSDSGNSSIYPMSNYIYQSTYLLKNLSIRTMQQFQAEIDSINQPQYNTTQNFGIKNGRWYFIYSAVKFAASGGQSTYGLFDSRDATPKNWAIWNENTAKPDLTFQSDLLLTFGKFSASTNDYRAVMFAGAYAVASYIDDPNIIYNSLGFSQRISSILETSLTKSIANMIALYIFDSMDDDVILDRSGNQYNGIMSNLSIFSQSLKISIAPDKAPIWDVSDPVTVSLANGPLFTGSQKITTRTIKMAPFFDVMGLFGSFITVQFSSNKCSSPKKMIIFQLTNQDKNDPSLIVGSKYINPTTVRLTLVDSDDKTTEIPKDFPLDTRINIIFFCSNYADGLLFEEKPGGRRQFCAFYFEDTKSYYDISIHFDYIKTFENDNSIVLQLGDSKDSFCGYIQRFEFFTNSSFLQEDSSTCTALLGGIQPICLPTYNGNTPCAVGTYSDPDSGTCQDCQAECLDCTSSLSCTICKPGYSLTSQLTCVTPMSCSENCLVCFSPTTCIICKFGYDLSNGVCQTTCPHNYYFDEETGACKKQPTILEPPICDSPKILYGSTCMLSCPPNSTYDKEQNQCVSCSSNCVSCTGTSSRNCSLCPSDQFLFKGRCFNSCPTGMRGSSSPDLPGPQCLLKETTSISLTRTTDPTQFQITFNNSSLTFLTYIATRLEISLQNNVLNDSNFTATVSDPNTIDLEILTQEYAPADSTLQVTLKISSNFNEDPTQEFIIAERSASVLTFEISSLPLAEKESSEQMAATQNVMGGAVSAAQLSTFMLSGGVSPSLFQLQFYNQGLKMSTAITANYPPALRAYSGNTQAEPSKLLFTFFSFFSSSSEQSSNKRRILLEQNSNASSKDIISDFGDQISLCIVLVCIGITLHVIAKLLHLKPVFGKYHKTISSVWQSVDQLVNWNLLLIYFSLVLFPGVYYSSLQLLSAIQKQSEVNSASFIFAIIFFVFSIGLIIFTIVEVREKLNATNSNPKTRRYTAPKSAVKLRLGRSACLTEGLKNNYKLQQYHFPLLLSRAFLTAVLLGLLSSFPLVQAALVVVINFTFLLYEASYRPLKDKILMALTLVIEALVLVGYACVLALVIINPSEQTADTRAAIGKVYIGTSLGNVIVGLLFSLVQIAKMVLAVRRACKGKSFKENLKMCFERITNKNNANSPEEEENKKIMGERPCTIEEVWSTWRKSIVVIAEDEWKKPENLEKLCEIANWAKELLARDNSEPKTPLLKFPQNGVPSLDIWGAE